MVLGLALVHHLALASNVPLAEVVAWLHSFGSPLVVEFVEPHDPMAARLLANKPAGLFTTIASRCSNSCSTSRSPSNGGTLPSGSRTLYSALPWT